MCRKHNPQSFNCNTLKGVCIKVFGFEHIDVAVGISYAHRTHLTHFITFQAGFEDLDLDLMDIGGPVSWNLSGNVSDITAITWRGC